MNKRRKVEDAIKALQVFDINYFSQLPNDVIRNIALMLPVEYLYQLQKVLKRVDRKVVLNTIFWEDLFISRYGRDVLERFNYLKKYPRRLFFAYSAYRYGNSKKIALTRNDGKRTVIQIEGNNIILRENPEGHIHIPPDVARYMVEIIFGDPRIDARMPKTYEVIDGYMDIVVVNLVAALMLKGYRTSVLPPTHRGAKSTFNRKYFLKCKVCDNDALVKCCQDGLYCGSNCREIDWVKHKKINH